MNETAEREASSPKIEPKETIELHVRHVPRTLWLKARHAALASGLPFGQYIIKLLEQAEVPSSSSNSEGSLLQRGLPQGDITESACQMFQHSEPNSILLNNANSNRTEK